MYANWTSTRDINIEWLTNTIFVARGSAAEMPRASQNHVIFWLSISGAKNQTKHYADAYSMQIGFFYKVKLNEKRKNKTNETNHKSVRK